MHFDYKFMYKNDHEHPHSHSSKEMLTEPLTPKIHLCGLPSAEVWFTTNGMTGRSCFESGRGGGRGHSLGVVEG